METFPMANHGRYAYKWTQELPDGDLKMLRVYVTLLALLVACTPVWATTWHVDKSGAGDATSIAGGIQLAATGDTVLIKSGVYFENSLHVDKSLAIVGETPNWPTVIGSGANYI